MADKPAAEVAIDEALVRRLLLAQAGDVAAVATLPLERAAAGWDSEIWRLGDDLAVRLPRRAVAAPLVLNEHRSLAIIGPRIEATGVRVPAPVVRGAPSVHFPWAWSVVPWISGTRGLDLPRSQRRSWGPALAGALAALHADAPSDPPVNPVRGRPLASRADVVGRRLDALAASGSVRPRDARLLRTAWADGLAADAWSRPPVWIHGDLHPGNLVAEGPRLAGIIDFGDVTAGDPAYDLAVAWLAFDPPGRARFIAATGERYDSSTWTRARAWASAVAVLLLGHSDDDPDYADLGRCTLDELASGA